MRKTYLFIIILIISTPNQAQDLKKNGYPQAILKKEFRESQIKNKAPGRVLYSEDFDSTGNAANNGLPFGWTVQDNTGNNFNWIWSNSAPGGQYSTSLGPLQSTTGSNGYLLLPSDSYNTPTAGSPIPMDASVSSPAILIPANQSVTLRFEQYYRYCCGSFSELVVEVSNDNINWTSYDITLGRSQSAVTPNPELMEIDVTPTLGNQTTAYIRFRQSLASHYFFMVDDLEIIEGYSNALELTKYSIDFGSNKNINPIYTQLPIISTSPIIGFEIEAKNIGRNPQTGVQGKLEVYHDSSIMFSIGNGLIGDSAELRTSPLLNLENDTFHVKSPTITLDGYFRFKMTVDSDSINEKASAATEEFSFVFSDTVFARDNNEFNLTTGPSKYIGSSGVGDKWGVLYDYIGNNFFANTLLISSISLYVGKDTQNINTGIQPRVWHFDDSKSTIDSAITNPPIGSSPFTLTITPSMLDNWLSISLFPPAILSSGEQYVVGWEQILGSDGFLAGRDTSAEKFTTSASNFVFTNGTNPQWGWVSQAAGIRLNLPGYVNINEFQLKTNLEIYPNPSNGQFALRLKSETAKQYTLKVRNNLGQIVLEEQVNVNGHFAKAIDLSHNEAGIYFLSLENEQERLVEKLIIQ